MYNVFDIPEDFLTHQYSDEEMNEYDEKIQRATRAEGSIKEAINSLTPSQKRKVDGWGGSYRVATDRHDQVFGKGNDRIVIPLDRSNEAPIKSRHLDDMNSTWHKSVNTVLRNHGYSVHDWVKGHAIKSEHIDRDNPPVISIGKVLNKIKGNNEGDPSFANAPSGIYNKGKYREDGTREEPKMMSNLDAFNADPMRASGKGEHVMVVTRNKYDVAGKSTNQNWKSCMDMVGGCNRRYLPKDIDHGTLAVFLAHKDIDSPTLKPLARVSAKRYDSDDGKEIQYVPEDRYYGNPHGTFKKAVNEFFDKHYPIGDKDYHMHRDLYADTGKTSILKRNYASMNTEEAIHTLTDHAKRAVGDIVHAINNFGDKFEYEYPHYAVSNALESVKNRMYKMNDGDKFAAGAKFVQEHESNNHGRFERTEDTNDEEQTHSQLIAESYLDNHNDNDLVSHAKSMSRDHLLRVTHDLGDSLNDHGDGGYRMYGAAHTAAVHHIEHKLRENNDTGAGDDEMLHHLVKHISDAPDAAHDAYNSHGFEYFGGSHPALLSRNPRTIHHLLDFNEEHSGSSGLIAHDDLNNIDKRELAYHIGKHADLKLAHSYHEHMGIGDQDYESFVKGLNHNPEGEHIQHSLTSRMYFGNTEHGMPVHHVGGPIYDRINGLRKANVVHFHERAEVRDGDLFNSVADHSRFPSVLKSLIGRHDTDDEVKEKAKGQLPFANSVNKPVTESYEMSSQFDKVLDKILKESFDNKVLPVSSEPEPNEKSGHKSYDQFVKEISAYFMGEKPEVEIEDDDEDDKEPGSKYNQKDEYRSQIDSGNDDEYIGEAKKKKSKKKDVEKAPVNQILINPDKDEI